MKKQETETKYNSGGFRRGRSLIMKDSTGTGVGMVKKMENRKQKEG